MQDESEERYEEEEMLEFSDYTDLAEEDSELATEQEPIQPVLVSAKTAQEIIESFQKSGKQPLTVKDCPVSVFSEVYVAFKKTKDAVVGYDYDTNTLTIN